MGPKHTYKSGELIFNKWFNLFNEIPDQRSIQLYGQVQRVKYQKPQEEQQQQPSHNHLVPETLKFTNIKHTTYKSPKTINKMECRAKWGFQQNHTTGSGLQQRIQQRSQEGQRNKQGRQL